MAFALEQEVRSAARWVFWWYLDEGNDGVFTVVHSWSYTPLDRRQGDHGEEVYRLEEGLRLAPAEAEARIKKTLAEKGMETDE